MATFNLTPETTSANLLETIGEDDVVVVGRSGDALPIYQAIGFETGDILNLREFPELTAEVMLAVASSIIGGVRFDTPFFTLTLAGITLGQLSAENFIFNSPPTAAPDSTTIPEGGTATIPVLANDSDADGDSFSITGVGTPTNGAVIISSDQLVYNPAESTFSGVDSFIYTITDSRGETGTASVTVTVGGNQPPDAVADTVEAIAGIANRIDVLANDSDFDRDVLSIASVSNGTNGTVSIVDSQVVYTPNETTFTGTDTFNYTITDGNGGTDQATVNVTVVENQDPIAARDRTTIPAGGTASISVLENDSDPNGQQLSIVGISDPLNGSTAIRGDQVIYTPATNSAASALVRVTDAFFYTISDGSGGTASSTVIVTIGGPQPPVAVDDSAVTALATAVTIDVLANDTDADEDSLFISGIGSGTPNGGTLSLSGNEVVYTPAATFGGIDSFVYTVSDGNGGVDTATVTVAVGSLSLVANNDTATVVAGQAAIEIDVRANDSDPDGSFTITGVSVPGRGSARIFDSGTLENPADDVVIYEPNSSFRATGGTDTFTYTITNNDGRTDTATVTVLTNQPPVAIDDRSTIQTLATATIAVLDNDSDPDGNSLQILGISPPDNGTATLDENNQVIYIPRTMPNGQPFSGTESFTYSISDGSGGTQSATIRVQVGGNQPPVAVNDTVTVTAGGGAQSLDLLANDSDPDRDPLTVDSVQTSTANGGTVAISNNGVVYTAPQNTETEFVGTDSFTYTITDGQGGTDSGTVTVTIDENTGPTAVNDMVTISGSSNITNTIDVLENDSDPDIGDILRVIGADNSSSLGRVAISDNQVTYTAASGLETFEGNDTVVYTISDAGGLTSTATIRVVFGDIVPPNALRDTTSTSEGTATTIDVLANDRDQTGDPSLRGFGQGSNGTVTRNNGGTPNDRTDDLLVYDPRDGFIGTDTFTYTIAGNETLSDGTALTDTARVTITVGSNQRPSAINDRFIIPARGSATLAVLNNDSDPNGERLRISQNANTTINTSSLGTVTVNSDRSGLIYTVSAGINTAFEGTDTFTYTIVDGGGETDTATVTVRLGGNQQITANNDFAIVISGETTTIPVLLNDNDTNNSSMTITLGDDVDPVNTVGVRGNNITFTGTADDEFTYTISNGANTATATVTVDVLASTTNSRPLDLTAEPIVADSQLLLVGTSNTSGIDELTGSGNADILIGGLGSDRLEGGAGADIFYFQDESDSLRATSDTIQDFNTTEDFIQLTSGFGNVRVTQPIPSQPIFTLTAGDNFSVNISSDTTNTIESRIFIGEI